MVARYLIGICLVLTSGFGDSAIAGAGCDAYRMDLDMYQVCNKRGLPTHQSTRGGFSYRPVDTDISAAPLPLECRDGTGQPTWHGAPDIVEWTYCDNLNAGCEYYVFVEKFVSLDELRLKDTLNSVDKVQAFIQACRQSTFGAAHTLAYVGTYPLSAYEFLDALFATQSGFRPKDAFGFDGMRRQALALAPSPAFKFESLLFDTSLAPIVRNLNGIIREFESFRKTVMPEAEELATLQRSKNLAAPQRDRMRELQENPDVLFIKVFNEEHTKGVLREKKTSNAAAADALKKALPVYPSGDARRERFEAIAQRLRAALKDFDHRVDLDITSLSRQRPERELVYHTGDVLYLFLKGIGAANPKLRIVLSIRRQATPEASAIVEGSVGVVTRAFNDPPELNRQQNIVFASDYLRYWVSFFTQPVLVANASLIGAPEGVAENRALIAEVPGSYIAVLELLDETTGSRSQIETKFSVVQ